jgi:DNA-binding Lrp family transcriptional regulator
MVRAYVTVTAHTGEADRLRTDIEAVDGVERAHVVAGDVDIIALVDVDTPAAVKDIVATGLQDIEGVGSTETYVAME